MFGALLVWGDEATYRPLLPRMFELAAEGSLPGPRGIADVIGTLGRSDWKKWPDTEQLAIRNYLDAWWPDRLERSADSHEILWVLSALAALRNTARLILGARYSSTPLGEERGRHPHATAQIRAWLEDGAPALRARFEEAAEAAFEADDEATFDLLSTASTFVTHT